MDAGNIHVVYWGVDEAFFRFLETVKPSLAVQPGSLLFAGGWQARKGIGTLVEALEGLSDDWRLEIAGGIDPRSENIPGMDAFLARQQVKYLGILPRSELAAVMKRHRIFVFPSFCEGSARVIFEALAAGCYVITTPNSGSIVQDRVHGRLIAPGDISGLRNAIATAIANPDLVKSVGEDNAQLVATKFRQRDYGNKIKKLYERLLA
jgi:glycosyltransferase involved in cell wall biosynthesis